MNTALSITVAYLQLIMLQQQTSNSTPVLLGTTTTNKNKTKVNGSLGHKKRYYYRHHKNDLHHYKYFPPTASQNRHNDKLNHYAKIEIPHQLNFTEFNGDPSQKLRNRRGTNHEKFKRNKIFVDFSTSRFVDSSNAENSSGGVTKVLRKIYIDLSSQDDLLPETGNNTIESGDNQPLVKPKIQKSETRNNDRILITTNQDIEMDTVTENTSGNILIGVEGEEENNDGLKTDQVTTIKSIHTDPDHETTIWSTKFDATTSSFTSSSVQTYIDLLGNLDYYDFYTSTTPSQENDLENEKIETSTITADHGFTETVQHEVFIDLQNKTSSSINNTSRTSNFVQSDKSNVASSNIDGTPTSTLNFIATSTFTPSNVNFSLVDVKSNIPDMNILTKSSELITLPLANSYDDPKIPTPSTVYIELFDNDSILSSQQGHKDSYSGTTENKEILTSTSQSMTECMWNDTDTNNSTNVSTTETATRPVPAHYSTVNTTASISTMDKYEVTETTVEKTTSIPSKIETINKTALNEIISTTTESGEWIFVKHRSKTFSTTLNSRPLLNRIKNATDKPILSSMQMIEPKEEATPSTIQEYGIEVYHSEDLDYVNGNHTGRSYLLDDYDEFALRRKLSFNPFLQNNKT